LDYLPPEEDAMNRTSYFLLVLAAIITQPLAAADPTEQRPGLEEILREWGRRTSRSKTVFCEWEATTSHRTKALEQKAAARSKLPMLGLPGFRPPAPQFDEAFVKTRTKFAVQLSPDGVWFQISGSQWDISMARFVNKTFWSFQDDKDSFKVFINPERTQVVPEYAAVFAEIHPGSAVSHPLSPAALPLALHFRGTEPPATVVDRKTLKTTSEIVLVNGQACMRMEDLWHSYWVNVESPFLIRRCKGRRSAFLTDMEYELDADGGWALTGWTTRRGKENLANEVAVCVVKNMVLNGSVKLKEALTQLPAGADVHDHRGETPTRYLIRKDGTQRMITMEDLKYGLPTYDELRNSEPGLAIPVQFRNLYDRVLAALAEGPRQREEAFGELEHYVRQHPTRARHIELVARVANKLFNSDNPEAAPELCHRFARVSNPFHLALLPQAERFEGELRRKRLLGSAIRITGRTVDGESIDWQRYRGKFVLVYFWFTGCKPCIQEMPRIKQLYEQYNADGFEVVGISNDQSKERLVAYLKEAEIPWATIHEDPGRGTDLDVVRGNDQNVARYNIRVFPTAILVDRDGTAMHLEARGEVLAQLLLGLFGEK